MTGALPALGVSSLEGWAKPLAAVDEIALAESWIGRAEVEGRERRIAVGRMNDIMCEYVCEVYVTR
jgi:hypothetical protein